MSVSHFFWSVTDLYDPSHNVNVNGYDVYVPYVDFPLDFWINLKADKEMVTKVVEDLNPKLKKTILPVEVGPLSAVEHSTLVGKFRERIISVH